MKVTTIKQNCCKHDYKLIHNGKAEYKKGERDVHKFYGSYERCRKCGKVKKNFVYLGADKC